MKTTTLVLFFSILILATKAMDTQSARRFLLSTVRSPNVGKLCAGYSTKASLVDDKAKTQATANNDALKASFGVTGSTLFGNIVGNPSGIMAGALAELPTVLVPLAIFVAPFVIGLVLILLISPYLCCCCCCPNCCPSKCCQKPDNEQYTKCELVWPAIVLILAFLVVIVGSVIGFTRSSDIQTSYKTVTCSVSYTFDDILYGNFSSTNKYFIGIKNLVSGLNDLSGNVGSVGTQLGKLKDSNSSSPLMILYNEGTNILTKISQIPTGTAGQTMAAFGYKHFDNTGTVTDVPSIFPTILGTATGAANSGIVPGATVAFKTVNDGFKTIAQNAETFSSQVGTISGPIGQLSSSMSSMADIVASIDTGIGGGTDTISPVMGSITTAVSAFFGVFIGLGVIGILATLLMTCCEKFSCRYLLYFICFVFFILGFLSFFLSLLFSVLTPVLYFGCDFLTASISSGANFQANFGKVVDPQLTKYLSVCLPGGSGDIINQLGSVDLSGVNSLTDVVNKLNSFSATTIQAGVELIFSTMEGAIDDYYYTKLYDFSSSSDENILNKIGNPSLYACNSNSFSQDFWVPNIGRSPNGCPGSATTASSAQCPTTAEIGAGRTGPGSCYGCMDSIKVLINAGATQSATLNTRYSDASCTTWKTDMMNLWTSYYNQKVTKYGPVQSRATAVRTTYNTATTGYKAKIIAAESAFGPIKTQLTTIVQSVVDPQYGIFAGLNCLLLGEDINLISNTACVRLFNTFYFLRFALGIAAFGILFTLCCVTCSGVRAFKHSQRRGSALSKDQINDENTMNNLYPKA